MKGVALSEEPTGIRHPLLLFPIALWHILGPFSLLFWLYEPPLHGSVWSLLSILFPAFTSSCYQQKAILIVPTCTLPAQRQRSQTKLVTSFWK